MAGDLHCHTKLSTGSMGIDDLIVLAKKRGMTHIAITDQDCMAGTIRGRVIGDRYGVTVLHGVEISCSQPDGREAHMLCYLSESPNRLEGLCYQNIAMRRKAAQYMLLKFVKRYSVSHELVQECAKGATCLYPQHMMRALLESGLTDRIYGDIYHDLFSPDSPRNILYPAKFPAPCEVLEAIHQAGGIAVLAHPGENGAMELLEDLVAAGLDGVEVFHGANSREVQKQLLGMAKNLNMLVTGGSDFRGMYGPGFVTVGHEQVNDSQINSLLTYKSRQRRAKKAAV